MSKQTTSLLVCATLLALLTSSCQKENEVIKSVEYNVEQQKRSENDDSKFKVTIEEANQIVKDFISSSEFRSSNKSDREIDFISEFSSLNTFRSTSSKNEELNNSFYLAQFKGNNGYALISKDKRTFPIFAVLDKGRFCLKDIESKKSTIPFKALIKGHKREIEAFNNAIKSKDRFRSNSDPANENWENAIQEFLNDGWTKSRQTPNRLTVDGQYIKWRQKVLDNKFLDSNGVLFKDAYPNEPRFDDIDWEEIDEDGLRSSKEKTDVFGCTPVAYGQVLYALKDYPGFKDLKYSNGEPVLWDRMPPYTSLSTENQRFLGWITENCSPTYFDDGTMVYNSTAKSFVRDILGRYISSRYDNCIVGDGDFDGYGKSEDNRVSEEFFKYPNCFVIMTASAGGFNYWDYHTYVIDGMVEFKKRIKDSGWFGWGWFSEWHNATRHLYHINAGWGGISNGYYLYVQDVDDDFEYTGKNDAMDYRSKVAYFIIRPN